MGIFFQSKVIIRKVIISIVAMSVGVYKSRAALKNNKDKHSSLLALFVSDEDFLSPGDNRTVYFFLIFNCYSVHH